MNSAKVNKLWLKAWADAGWKDEECNPVSLCGALANSTRRPLEAILVTAFLSPWKWIQIDCWFCSRGSHHFSVSKKVPHKPQAICNQITTICRHTKHSCWHGPKHVLKTACQAKSEGSGLAREFADFTLFSAVTWNVTIFCILYGTCSDLVNLVSQCASTVGGFTFSHTINTGYIYRLFSATYWILGFTHRKQCKDLVAESGKPPQSNV